MVKKWHFFQFLIYRKNDLWRNFGDLLNRKESFLPLKICTSDNRIFAWFLKGLTIIIKANSFQNNSNLEIFGLWVITAITEISFFALFRLYSPFVFLFLLAIFLCYYHYFNLLCIVIFNCRILIWNIVSTNMYSTKKNLALISLTWRYLPALTCFFNYLWVGTIHIVTMCFLKGVLLLVVMVVVVLRSWTSRPLFADLVVGALHTLLKTQNEF